MRRIAVAMFLALPLGLIPWLDEAFLSTVRPSFVQVVVTLLIAGTYAVVLQHHLAKHWLRADH